MNRAKAAMAAIVGAALLVAPANAEEPKPDLNDTVKRLEAAVKKLEAAELINEINSLRLRIDQLELDVKNLRQAAGSPSSSTSKRESMPEGPPKPGIIKLSNEFPEMMSVDVNGVSYQLLPGQQRVIKIDPGAFTFQVPQVQALPQHRTIGANEEKSIRIYAR
jgi:outer membrane murein-binding lipoprotein Lpp